MRYHLFSYLIRPKLKCRSALIISAPLPATFLQNKDVSGLTNGLLIKKECPLELRVTMLDLYFTHSRIRLGVETAGPELPRRQKVLPNTPGLNVNLQVSLLRSKTNKASSSVL